LSSRKERVRGLLKSILDDRGNPQVTTVELLYRCQEISKLLDLDEEQSSWIASELFGYPSQRALSRIRELKDYEYVPSYRWVKTNANFSTTNPLWLQTGLPTLELPTNYLFLVEIQCGTLEHSKNPVIITDSQSIDVEPERYSYGSETKSIPIAISGILSVDSMRGIVHSIRARVNDFATSHFIALEFDSSLHKMFDSTRNLLADKLGKLHPATLTLLEETIQSQESSKDPVEWINVIENIRSIIRSFTDQVIRSEMLSEEKSKPAKGETTQKTRIIIDWIKRNINESKGTESDYLYQTLDTMIAQKKVLENLINKYGHTDDYKQVSRGEVDRTLIMTVIWISDMISLLDKAKYEWSPR
jgi:hypothetical protein